MKIKEQGMGEYSLEPMCLTSLPTSPRSHGLPIASTHQATQPITMFDGTFIQLGTLAHESEEKDILSLLYKEEEEDRAATMEIAIPTHLYGKGYLIMQQMGYNGKGPIGKHQERVTKPLDPPSQFSKDKKGLGFKFTLLPKIIPRKYQKPWWKAKKKYKEESWQEALFESIETIRKEREHQEKKQQQGKPIIHKKATSTTIAHIHEQISNKAESPQGNIIPP